MNYCSPYAREGRRAYLPKTRFHPIAVLAPRRERCPVPPPIMPVPSHVIDQTLFGEIAGRSAHADNLFFGKRDVAGFVRNDVIDLRGQG